MRRRIPLKHSVLAGACLWMCATVAVAAQDQKRETEHKGFRVENTTVHAGEVKAGEMGEAVFVFHNDTAKDVKIVSAVPT